MKLLLLKLIHSIFIPMFLPAGICIALLAKRTNRPINPRLVWGEAPIINNVYWSNAMEKYGYQSETFTDDYCSTINTRKDYGKIVQDMYGAIPLSFKYYIAFLHSLFCYDVFFTSFNGFFLGKTSLWRFESFLLNLAGKKIVIIPFGLDAYVYRRIRSPALTHGLLSSISRPSRTQREISRRVDYWCKNANCVMPGFMGPDGLGRWDVLTPSPLVIDLDTWKVSSRENMHDGVSGSVVVAHAPNHRGFKGSEFVSEAIRMLKMEGLQIEFKLIEGVQNNEVRRILEEEADILVEQLIFPGHGLNGIEGLASGLPVVSNLENNEYLTPMRRWSYFGECPLVSATPESLAGVLRKLITRPELRKNLGKAGREYVEKYHGFDSAHYLFGNIIEYIYGRRDSLINIYHPLLGEYPNRKPKIDHPLVNNRIAD